MMNVFFVSSINEIDNDKCFREVGKYVSDEVSESLKEIVLEQLDDAHEKEEVVLYVEGYSIAGVKISKQKNGDTSVFLGWNASDMDVHLCYEYLRTVKMIYPEAVVTVSDSEGNMTTDVADFSEEALEEALESRFEMLAGLLALDEEVVRIPAIRYTYHLQPKKFADETTGMSIEEKVMMLYHNILDMQWYETPEPKTYMLRWNTDISNFKIKDFEDCMKQFKKSGFCLSWSIWDWQDARVGDKVYMLRIGKGTNGIVLRGVLVSDPYVDDDWSDKGRVVHYVDVRVEQMIHPDKGVILETEDLVARFDEIEWTGGHSGTLIDAKVAYHLDKCFDRYLVDNREQFMVSEQTPVALSRDEIPEMYKDYFDSNQGHGGHWETIVDTEKVDLVDFIQKHLSCSKEVDTVNTTMRDDGRMVSATIVGLTTDDVEIGMAALLIEDDEGYEFVSAYPALKEAGSLVTMRLVKVNEYANGIEGVLTCETKGGDQLCFYDTDYYLHKNEYKIGEIYIFKLGALASKAEKLPEDELMMLFSVEQTINMAKASGSDVEKDEDGNVVPFKCFMDQLVFCMNTIEETPDEYGFQSPARHSKAVKILGTAMYKMDITVVRTDDEPDAVVIPLYAKKVFFDKKPKKDEAVRGCLWLFGSMAV